MQWPCTSPHQAAIYKSIAADLGINRATLREWVLRDRERRGITAAAAKPGAQPREAVLSADPDERVRQLEARVAELDASERKLATERDILRKGLYPQPQAIAGNRGSAPFALPRLLVCRRCQQVELVWVRRPSRHGRLL